MTLSSSDLERKTLENLRKDFEARAYRFIAHPSIHDLPTFLKSYRPDAIAISDRDRVIIEIKTTKALQRSEVNLAKIVKEIPPNEGWRYVVVYAGQDISDLEYIPRSSKNQITRTISDAKDLIKQGYNQVSMLLIWSVLEALARRIYPDDIRFVQKPLSSSEIVERLAMEGELDIDEAKRLRSLRSLRNLIAHGDFEIKVSEDDVNFMLSVADRINSDIT